VSALRNPFEVLYAEISQLKQRGEQTSGAFGNHHDVRRRNTVQPSCNIGRLAGDIWRSSKARGIRQRSASR
jgi:hypothetical protein